MGIINWINPYLPRYLTALKNVRIKTKFSTLLFTTFFTTFYIIKKITSTKKKNNYFHNEKNFEIIMYLINMKK